MRVGYTPATVGLTGILGNHESKGLAAMPNVFTGWHLIVIVLVIVLLFGAPKLPQLARSVGQSMRIFKREIKQLNEEDSGATRASSTSASADGSPAAPATTAKSTSDADGTQPDRA